MPRARLIATNRSEYGQAALDIYTPLHFGLGFAAGAAGISPVKAALVFTIVKVVVAATERGIGHALLGRIPGESNINELCDLLAEISGIDAGAKVRASQLAAAAPPAQTISVTLPAAVAPVSGIFR